MPPCNGKYYLVTARDDLSGWAESRALANATSAAVARFIWEDIVYRHGCFGHLVVDGRLENKLYIEEFTARYGIKRVQVSSYHLQANGIVEGGHRPIIEALARMTNVGLRTR
jgi:hypothetical protein